MNNEDMSDIIQKLSSLMNQSNNESNNNSANENDVSSDSNVFNEDTLKNLMNQFASSNQSENTINNTNNDNSFNFDMNTILKMKNVMDKMNSNKNDPRANLLLSLKPYLNDGRKEKLDQYMQFLNISKVIEAFNSEGGVNSK